MKHVKLFEGWREGYDDDLEDREMEREMEYDDTESDPYISDREREEQYKTSSSSYVYGSKDDDDGEDLLVDTTIKSPTMSPADKLEIMMSDVEFTRKKSDSQRKMKKIRKWISSLSPEEKAGISM
jgi:hypothetical protein